MNTNPSFAELPPLSGEFETAASEFEDEDEIRRRRDWRPGRAAARSHATVWPRGAPAWRPPPLRQPIGRAIGRAFGPPSGQAYGRPYRPAAGPSFGSPWGQRIGPAFGNVFAPARFGSGAGWQRRLPLQTFAPRHWPGWRPAPWPVPVPAPWPGRPPASADDVFGDDGEPPPDSADTPPPDSPPQAPQPAGDAPQGEFGSARPRCGCARCASGSAGEAEYFLGSGESEGDFEADFESDFEADSESDSDFESDTVSEFELEFEDEASPAVCGPYEKTEVFRSRSDAGLLPADVTPHPRGLLIADFGVDWRTPRESLRKDAVLRRWLETAAKIVEANPKTTIRILGYSDCIGSEKNNLHLRKGRAERVAPLLLSLLGKGPAWTALKARLGTALPAPGGEYVAPNDSVEGRARNRGVLIEMKREISFAPERVCAVTASQAATYPLLRVIPNRADVPRGQTLDFKLHAKRMIGDVAQDISQNGNKAHFWVELVHAGLTAAEIFAEGSALVGLLSIGAPLLALAGVFMALGAPYAEAAKKIAEDSAASGYARGLVMGADGRKAKELRDYFGNDVMQTYLFEQGQKIATANYRLGLLVGFVHGRLLCPNQRAAFWTDMRNRLQGDQTYRGPSKQWSRREWIDWYVTTAATFRTSHLQ